MVSIFSSTHGKKVKKHDLFPLKCLNIPLCIRPYLCSTLPSLAPLWENRNLIRSPFLSPSHMDDCNRHIVLGQCHCGFLWALPLWHWSQWTWSPRTSTTVSCCVWGKGEGRSSVWGCRWVHALPLQLLLCRKDLNHSFDFFCTVLLLLICTCAHDARTIILRAHTANTVAVTMWTERMVSLAHHGNTSCCAGPAAAFVFSTLHANQISCVPNTYTPF